MAWPCSRHLVNVYALSLSLPLGSSAIVIIVTRAPGGGPNPAFSERWDEGALSWQSEDRGFPRKHCPAVGLGKNPFSLRLPGLSYPICKMSKLALQVSSVNGML